MHPAVRECLAAPSSLLVENEYIHFPRGLHPSVQPPAVCCTVSTSTLYSVILELTILYILLQIVTFWPYSLTLLHRAYSTSSGDKHQPGSAILFKATKKRASRSSSLSSSTTSSQQVLEEHSGQQLLQDHAGEEVMESLESQDKVQERYVNSGELTQKDIIYHTPTGV